MTEPDERTGIAKIIQQTFFPYPPTQWEGMTGAQQQEFFECADEIIQYRRDRQKQRRAGKEPS